MQNIYKIGFMSDIIPMCGIVTMSDVVIMRGVVPIKQEKKYDGRRID